MSYDNRIGIGYDIHRLAEGRKLVLGGVDIPFEKGLLGHSDSDVLIHALCDALLGAAALGDIGTHFPDSDPQWAEVSSLEFLKRVMELMSDRGFRVANVDGTVVAERPKLQPYVQAMRERLASALQIDVDRVSIKAKTNEGLEAIGRGEAIAAQVVALIHRRDAEYAEEAQR
ncbi:MAG TPA: 2-C-methyl-D-erythritol 2,4-cyclodiphosphate synthase [Blastocatellia bacterium]|nr:2-C-methyl-D-erythritol 2,4-cyclodiphosphate synthase [Blastocatellia bacterium]